MIDRLRARVAALVGAYERVKCDLQKRASERDKLLAEREELERKVAGLEQRIRVLELAGGMEGVSGGSKAARERVNRLLREVDRCLALMNLPPDWCDDLGIDDPGEADFLFWESVFRASAKRKAASKSRSG